MEQKDIEFVTKSDGDSTFNKLQRLQELLNKESALKELCKQFLN
jgi:hypothetical protein